MGFSLQKASLTTKVMSGFTGLRNSFCKVQRIVTTAFALNSSSCSLLQIPRREVKYTEKRGQYEIVLAVKFEKKLPMTIQVAYSFWLFAASPRMVLYTRAIYKLEIQRCDLHFNIFFKFLIPLSLLLTNGWETQVWWTFPVGNVTFMV